MDLAHQRVLRLGLWVLAVSLGWIQLVESKRSYQSFRSTAVVVLGKTSAGGRFDRGLVARVRGFALLWVL